MVQGLFFQSVIMTKNHALPANGALSCGSLSEGERGRRKVWPWSMEEEWRFGLGDLYVKGTTENSLLFTVNIFLNAPYVESNRTK